MLNFCQNINAVARIEFYSLFSFFLIVTTSRYAYKNLSAATLCVMYMPVISTVKWGTPLLCLDFTGFNSIQNCVLCLLSLYNPACSNHFFSCSFDWFPFNIFPSIISASSDTLSLNFSTVFPNPLPPEVANKIIFLPVKS